MRCCVSNRTGPRKTSVSLCERQRSSPFNSRFNVVVQSPTPFGLGRNGCWPSGGSQLPRALPSHKPFFHCFLNNRRRAARSLFKIGSLCSLFSCLSLARFRLLILFLFQMSGNVHPNPGPVFSCSVCTGNVSAFSISQPKALHSRAKACLSELRRATRSEEYHSSFCSPFSPLNFLWLPPTFLCPLPLVQTKLLIPC